MSYSPNKSVGVQLVVEGLQHHLQPFAPHSLEAGLSQSLIQLLPEIERLCHLPCETWENAFPDWATNLTINPIPEPMAAARYTASDLHLLLKALEEDDCNQDARCSLENLRREIQRLLT